MAGNRNGNLTLLSNSFHKQVCKTGRHQLVARECPFLVSCGICWEKQPHSRLEEVQQSLKFSRVCSWQPEFWIQLFTSVKYFSHTVGSIRKTIGKSINVFSISISTQYLNGSYVATFLVSMAMRSKMHEKQGGVESYFIFHITSLSQ